MIFYFSGTGNTRWAAQQLAKATGERMLFIPEEMKGECRYTLADNERIGFCFPVHGWQPPRIVRDFISRISFINYSKHYCFALCTCGDETGEAITIFNKDLSKHGIKALSVFSLIMPETYVCLPFMYTDTEEREKQKICEAEETLKEIADVVRQCKSGIEMLTKGPAPKLYSYVFGAFFNKRMITDKPFSANDACIGCGMCAKACPTENIVLDNDSHPHWRHEGLCTCCLACYHHCPKHAINYGRITKKRGQYYFKLHVNKYTNK